MTAAVEPLRVVRAAALESRPPERRWLLEGLWGLGAVGLIGGPPKCCKSWLGLDMATSVASGTPCLGHFAVGSPGPCLVYLAEDAIPMVRARIEALCAHRGLDIGSLDLHVIVAPALRLDLETDRRRLASALEEIRPRLLLLDPLVRLHRLDENSAAEISGLLGFLRELQRRFDTAVVLVHHASKKHRAHPGQALRGSGDLHAFGDDNAYLACKEDCFVLTIEHRAAKAPEPVAVRLVSRPDGSATHLELRGPVHAPADPSRALADAVAEVLARADGPLPRTAIRSAVRVNNQRLGDVLDRLERLGEVFRTSRGWQLVAEPRAVPGSATGTPA